MLSHGAIIAREFGIPSVVGVKDATRRIPHGGSITVDGDRGLVQAIGSCEMILAYLAERSAASFVPLAAHRGSGVARRVPGANSAATRRRAARPGAVPLWDDIADRDRDAIAHPERVLVRAARWRQSSRSSGALAT